MQGIVETEEISPMAILIFITELTALQHSNTGIIYREETLWGLNLRTL